MAKTRKGPVPRSLDELAAGVQDRHHRNYFKRRVRAEAMDVLATLYAARQHRDQSAENEALQTLAAMVPHLLNATCTVAQWEKVRTKLPRDDGPQLSLLVNPDKP